RRPSPAVHAIRWRSGAHPAWSARAASPAPRSPPSGKSACSRERKWLPSSFSRATACAFIDTSRAPLHAPRKTRARASVDADPASRGRGRPRHSPTRVEAPRGRVPVRARSHPASGIAPRAPTAIPRRARPRGPVPTPSRVCTNGMCGYQLASAAPFAKKTKARAARPRALPPGDPTLEPALGVQVVAPRAPRRVPEQANRLRAGDPRGVLAGEGPDRYAIAVVPAHGLRERPPPDVVGRRDVEDLVAGQRALDGEDDRVREVVDVDVAPEVGAQA